MSSAPCCSRARAHVLVRALGLRARGALGLGARGHERQLARLLRLRSARVLPNEKTNRTAKQDYATMNIQLSPV